MSHSNREMEDHPQPAGEVGEEDSLERVILDLADDMRNQRLDDGLSDHDDEEGRGPVSLINDLLESNAPFRALVEKSKASPRRPFPSIPDA
jgi:hypothetical protein